MKNILLIEDKFAPFRKAFNFWRKVGFSYEQAVVAARFKLAMEKLSHETRSKK